MTHTATTDLAYALDAVRWTPYEIARVPALDHSDPQDYRRYIAAITGILEHHDRAIEEYQRLAEARRKHESAI